MPVSWPSSRTPWPKSTRRPLCLSVAGLFRSTRSPILMVVSPRTSTGGNFSSAQPSRTVVPDDPALRIDPINRQRSDPRFRIPGSTLSLTDSGPTHPVSSVAAHASLPPAAEGRATMILECGGTAGHSSNRRLEDRRCRRLQRGRSGARHRRTAARRPLGGANTLGRRADPGDRSDHGMVAAVREPRRGRAARDQHPSRHDHLLGGVVRARLHSRWAAAGSVIAGGTPPIAMELAAVSSEAMVCALPGWRPASVGQPVLRAGRREPHESTWMSSYGRYGGASPQPHRGTGACAMTSASGCELLSAIRVPHSR